VGLSVHRAQDHVSREVPRRATPVRAERRHEGGAAPTIVCPAPAKSWASIRSFASASPRPVAVLSRLIASILLPRRSASTTSGGRGPVESGIIGRGKLAWRCHCMRRNAVVRTRRGCLNGLFRFPDPLDVFLIHWMAPPDPLDENNVQWIRKFARRENTPRLDRCLTSKM
jgi:hypothetical protein